MAAEFGVLCRLLWYSSLAFNTTDFITLELTTPRSIAPDGIALCFDNPSFSQQADQVRVQSLQQGGSLWVPGQQRELIGAEWEASAFFQTPAAEYLGPVHATDVVTSLAGDPYYATSYTVARYDDLDVGQQGSPIPVHLLQHTATQLNSSGLTAGHCLILSGKWQASTRYQLTLSVLNPSAAASSTAVLKPPDLWLAHLSYEVMYDSEGKISNLLMHVRGSKQGQLCQLRPKAAALLPRMFNACDAAVQWQVATAGGTANTTACVEALQSALASNASLANTFPFNVPPITTALGPASNPDVSCAAGKVLSGQLGGECIECANAAILGTNCTCYPGYSTNLMGPAACGPPINPTGNATNAAALAGQLCQIYSSAYDKMMLGQLSDHLVHSMYLNAFREQAAYLLDWTSIYQGNQTFWRDYMVDGRMASSPSRRTGIGPNCTACRNGMFKDIYTGKQVPVRDDRFKAVNTFRLIGYLLMSAGYPCPQLLDPDNPLEWMYGSYKKAMCAAV